MKRNVIRFNLCHVILLLLILVGLSLTEDSKGYAAISDEIMTQSYSLTEADTNHTPTDITLTNMVVKENSASGTPVALINVNVEDNFDTYRYFLSTGVDSEDNECFVIIGNELRMITIPDFETKNYYNIRIRVYNRSDSWFERPFKIIVANVYEAPTEIILSSNVVDKNAPDGTLIGTLSTRDEDLGDYFYYTLENTEFNISNLILTLSGNSLCISQSREYEPGDYIVKIRSRDSAGLSLLKDFIIKVGDIKENGNQVALPDQILDDSQPQVNEKSTDGKENVDVVEIPPENKKEKKASMTPKLLMINDVLVKGSRVELEVDDSLNAIELNITVSNAATWKLYSNATCTKPINDNKIKLKVGKNKVYIVVKSMDEKHEKTYSIVLLK